MKRHCQILSLLILTFSFISLIYSGCSSKQKWYQEEGAVWNTTFHIIYKSNRNLQDSILYTLKQVGNSLSIFNRSSLVNLVNKQSMTLVDAHFIKVYNASLSIHRATHGAFDPTLSPLITAWGFGPGHTPTSDTLRIDSIKAFVGIENTVLENNVLTKGDKRIQFNFSAIAKGYGCDAIGEMLNRNGISDYLIEIGGEILAKGNNPENGKWRISIDRPVLSADNVIHESQEIIEISNMGVATSGNYRNFHQQGGLRFGHTISAKTGRPIETDIISATVVAANAMEADGLATAFMAIGSEEVKKLNRELHLPIMLVLRDSSTWTSSEFSRLLPQITH